MPALSLGNDTTENWILDSSFRVSLDCGLRVTSHVEHEFVIFVSILPVQTSKIEGGVVVYCWWVLKKKWKKVMFQYFAKWKNVSLGGFLCCLFAVLPAKAQLPVVAGKSTAFDASLGVEYTRLTVPGSGNTGMAGPKGTFTVTPFRRWGIRADVAYQRSDNLLGTGHYNDAFTYMGGPVFYAIRTRRTNVYGQFLIGGARVAGVNNSESANYLNGYVNHLAWSFGGGVQLKITSPLALRVQGEYLHTSFYNTAEVVQGSYSPSGSLVLVYEFGGGHSR